jgi:hypothetical protein
MVGAFCQDGFESAHTFDGLGQRVAVYEFCVSENFWCLAEDLLDFFGVFIYLLDEFFLAEQKGKAVIIGFCQELDTSCLA